ncbi:MAG: glycogen debranching N-terminal domain-containing protein [Vampirovibrionales bacterium]|nr:glycogen debranching N-terminal domain-containing protein [Vampirovibrionales bacterium]
MSAQGPTGFSGVFRTIKYNHLFVVDDQDGAIPPSNLGGLGFYYMDTRHINQYELYINDIKPVTLLSSTESGNYSTLVYTNNQFESETDDQRHIIIPQETILVKRESVLNEGWFEKFTLVNYNDAPLKIKLTFRLGADFKDIFEVRNFLATTDGKLLAKKQKDNSLVFSYQDALHHVLETRVVFKDFKPTFTVIEDHTAEFYYETMLFPQEEQALHMHIIPISPLKKSYIRKIPQGFSQAFQKIQRKNNEWSQNATHFETDNEEFNELLSRCHQDIRMLVTRMRNSEHTDDDDVYLAAGIPWYVALFGRDSILSARSCLILKPDLAKTTLKTLAKYQGKKVDEWRDEEPGKILHELRVGELARLDKIPHTPYYGSVDATPLWLILLHDYYLWTRDIETLRQLWPNAMAALAWIDNNLNTSSNGFLSFETKSERGLFQQGWKDSHNSMMYANGKLAPLPLALTEVQGYVYMAKQNVAALAKIMGNTELEARLLTESQIFRERFNQAYWMEGYDYPPLGLDAEGKHLDVIGSNGGHCLETGIYKDEYVEPIIKRMMTSDMFNGWGIRTLSSRAVSYNPMSYHNGSIWPHDNALIARGLAKHGRVDDAMRIFSSLVDVGRMMPLKRIPELYCGFSRDEAKVDPPVRYPVACSPQAWAAASVYSLLQSLLNIYPRFMDGMGAKNAEQALIIENPRLPKWINYMKIENMKIGDASVTMEFERTQQSVLVNIIDRSQNIPIYVVI